jgi:hypothetical protein
VDLNQRFRLVLLSSITPEQCLHDELNGIDFALNKERLESILTVEVVKEKMPELEQRRVQITEKKQELTGQLVNIEDMLLLELSNATGNVVENDALLEKLKEAKDKAIKIEASLNESFELDSEIKEKRKVFKRLSETISRAYFTLPCLPFIRLNYSFSFQEYKDIYVKTIKATKGESIEEYLEFAIKNFARGIAMLQSSAILTANRFLCSNHHVNARIRSSCLWIILGHDNV